MGIQILYEFYYFEQVTQEKEKERPGLSYSFSNKSFPPVLSIFIKTTQGGQTDFMELDEKNTTRVKDKTPAPIQITAEQLLQEATARLQSTGSSEKARQRAKELHDRRDVGEYREQQRKGFEDNLRRNRGAIGVWIKYARFEESQHDFARARSIYERALDVDPRCVPLWIRYSEMEMRCRNVSMARNVLDRAVTIQPRIDQFWYKYAYMEEMCGEVGRAGEVWERWMAWEPEARVWWTYHKFATRHKNDDLAGGVVERLLAVHPEAENWIKAAKETAGDPNLSRAYYERALEHQPTTTLFVEFAKFEVQQGEIERARAVYRLGLDYFKAGDNCESAAPPAGLFNSYAAFERQYGMEQDLTRVLTVKRRREYEEALVREPLDYDTWFDLISLEEGEDSGGIAVVDKVREVFERAIANVPPSTEKRHWRRYAFLWLSYALFEETVCGERERALAVLQAALKTLPPNFTFTKLWSALAKLHIRRRDLGSLRRTLGQAVGMHPNKASLFRLYISLEGSLRSFDRCRTLYTRWITCNPLDTRAWVEFAEFEGVLGEVERARAVYALAVQVPALDSPELIWKSWIDAEVEWELDMTTLDKQEGEGEGEGSREVNNVEAVYELLLSRTTHPKAWLAYAQYHYNRHTNGNESLSPEGKARSVLERGMQGLKAHPPSRLLLLEAWLALELKYKHTEFAEKLRQRFPRRIKRRRLNTTRIDTSETGVGGGEEYWELSFPEDERAEGGALKLLQLAHQWKEQEKEQMVVNE